MDLQAADRQTRNSSGDSGLGRITAVLYCFGEATQVGWGSCLSANDRENPEGFSQCSSSLLEESTDSPCPVLTSLRGRRRGPG